MAEARAKKPWAVKLALSYLAGEPEAMTEDRLQALEMILHVGGRTDEYHIKTGGH